jgi:hypothetical protein
VPVGRDAPDVDATQRQVTELTAPGIVPSQDDADALPESGPAAR